MNADHMMGSRQQKTSRILQTFFVGVFCIKQSKSKSKSYTHAGDSVAYPGHMLNRKKDRPHCSCAECCPKETVCNLCQVYDNRDYPDVECNDQGCVHVYHSGCIKKNLATMRRRPVTNYVYNEKDPSSVQKFCCNILESNGCRKWSAPKVTPTFVEIPNDSERLQFTRGARIGESEEKFASIKFNDFFIELGDDLIIAHDAAAKGEPARLKGIRIINKKEIKLDVAWYWTRKVYEKEELGTDENSEKLKQLSKYELIYDWDHTDSHALHAVKCKALIVGMYEKKNVVFCLFCLCVFVICKLVFVFVCL